jgi:transposase-like protein
MEELKLGKSYTTQVSESFDKSSKEGVFEVSFRRWLVRELEEGRMTTKDAIERFNFNPVSGVTLLRDWRKKYSPSMLLALSEMTEQEKAEILLSQARIKELEKQVDALQMKVIAMDVLIDVAEEILNIDIRKKPGARQ